MKPRITRIWSIACNKYVWHCFGHGLIGAGHTPSDAYKIWHEKELHKTFLLWAKVQNTGKSS